jgi:hypothetical protein
MEHKMCVLIFSTILSEIFLIRTIMQRDVIVNVHSPFMYVCVYYYFQVFMKLVSSRYISEKNKKKIHENSSCGAELFHQ